MADQHSPDGASLNPLWYPALTPPVDLVDDRQLPPSSLRASDTPSLATPDSTSPETPVDLSSSVYPDVQPKLVPPRQLRTRPNSWTSRFSSSVHASAVPASFSTPPIPSPLVTATHPSPEMASQVAAAHLSSSYPLNSVSPTAPTTKSRYDDNNHTIETRRQPLRRDGISPSDVAAVSSSVPSKRARASNTEEDKRQSFLERNRQAACKSRQKKKDWIHNLERHAEDLTAENHKLQLLVTALQSEVRTLRENYESHRTCWPSTSMVNPQNPQQPPPPPQQPPPPPQVGFDSFDFGNPLDSTLAPSQAQAYPTPTPESSASSAASSSRNLPSLMDALARSANEQYSVAPQPNPATANPSAVAAAAAAAAQNTLTSVYDNMPSTSATQIHAPNPLQQQNLTVARHLRSGSFDFESLLNSERIRSPYNDIQQPPNSAPFQYDFLHLQTPTPERGLQNPAVATINQGSGSKAKVAEAESFLPVRALSAPPTTPTPQLDGRNGPMNSYFEPKQVKTES